MSTQAASTDPKEPVAPARGGALVLLFELEGVVCASRSALYDAARELLAASGQEFSRAVFVRHALLPTPELVAARLADRAGLRIQADALRAAYHTRLASAPASERFRALLAAALARNLPLAAVTALPEELAQSLSIAWRLAEKGVRLFCYPGADRDFPRVEAWVKASRAMGRPSRQAIGVTSHFNAMKTALAAGMRCIVLPDEFTGHQDFSGADAVVDAWEDQEPGELLDTLLRQAHL